MLKHFILIYFLSFGHLKTTYLPLIATCFLYGNPLIAIEKCKKKMSKIRVDNQFPSPNGEIVTNVEGKEFRVP